MSDYLQKLEEAKKLLDEGVLTPEEFEREKKKILAEGDKPPVAAPSMPQKITIEKKGGCGTTILILGAVVAGLAIIGSIIKSCDKGAASSPQRPTQTASAAPAKSEGDLLAEDVKFIEAFNNSRYRGSVDALLNEVRRFSVAWSNIGSAEFLPEHKETVAMLRKKLVALQKSEFPKIRKEYGAIVGNLMWEHNVDVATSGTTITFTAAMFASNGEIKGFHETVHTTLAAMRFKQARYKWFSGDDEYTYYKIECPGDGDKIEHYEIPS